MGQETDYTMGDLISIIIPAHNAEKYLAEAIQSVLAQTYTPVEIIVVDDGSEDDTSVIAHSFGDPVHCYKQAQSGVAGARNSGMEHARGELIAFLDADDFWPPEKLTIQYEALHARPFLEAVFGHAQNFHEIGDPPQARKMLAILPGYACGTMLIHKVALQRVGGFDSGWRVGDALEFFIRAREKNLRYIMLPDILLYRRIHDNNQGIRQKKEQRRAYTQLLKAALDRKRGKGSHVE
jgi:glycosyltransferase involved in cell wall biosynthesis